MSHFARVSSLDAIRDFKAAVIDFSEQAGVALSEAQSDVQRTLFWLQHDQQAHWQREIKKRTDKLTQAKSELHKKQIESSDMRTSAVLERKAVDAAQRRLDEAMEKLQRVKKWHAALEREYLLFKAQCQQIATVVAGDLPVATARMDRMIASLEAYIALRAPESGTRRTAIESAENPSELPRTSGDQFADDLVPIDLPPLDEGASP